MSWVLKDEWKKCAGRMPGRAAQAKDKAALRSRVWAGAPNLAGSD